MLVIQIYAQRLIVDGLSVSASSVVINDDYTIPPNERCSSTSQCYFGYKCSRAETLNNISVLNRDIQDDINYIGKTCQRATDCDRNVNFNGI